MSEQQQLRVGFIGLGKMGAGMCANVQKAGFPLIVYNRTEAKTKRFTDAGATAGGEQRRMGDGNQRPLSGGQVGTQVDAPTVAVARRHFRQMFDIDGNARDARSQKREARVRVGCGLLAQPEPFAPVHGRFRHLGTRQ